MSKSVLIRRTSLGKLIIRLWMAIVILLIPASSYSLPYQSPRTQNVEQTNVPDYISQAKIAVKKYYPQYEEYFETIFSEINGLDKCIIDVINEKIHENLKIHSEDLKTDKDKQTTILMIAERITWKNKFQTASDVININPEEWYDPREWIAERITRLIKKHITKQLNIMKKKQDIINRIDLLKNKDYLTKQENEELLKIIEDYFILIEGTEEIKDRRIIVILRTYVTRCREIWKEPNEIWKRIIKRVEQN